ncbi:MAG: hypothetical protein WBG90_10520 [Saonia sp.]
MKAVLTLIIVLFFGVVATAQDTKTESKVEVVTFSITSTDNVKEISIENENSVARLYKFKNSRVKKALAFTTKRNKAKLA